MERRRANLATYLDNTTFSIRRTKGKAPIRCQRQHPHDAQNPLAREPAREALTTVRPIIARRWTPSLREMLRKCRDSHALPKDTGRRARGDDHLPHGRHAQAARAHGLSSQVIVAAVSHLLQ